MSFGRGVVQWLTAIGVSVAAYTVDLLQQSIAGAQIDTTSVEGIVFAAVLGLATRGLGWLVGKVGPPRDDAPELPTP